MTPSRQRRQTRTKTRQGPSAARGFSESDGKDRKALATFEKFPPSQRKEYIEWVTEAKQSATRERRILQAVEWLAEGKPRHWQYMKK